MSIRSERGIQATFGNTCQPKFGLTSDIPGTYSVKTVHPMPSPDNNPLPPSTKEDIVRQ